MTSTLSNDISSEVTGPFNSDNVMDGRLEMSGHKIKGVGNPVDSDDAVNKEYITARVRTITGVLNGILERINKLDKNKTIT